MAELEMNTNAKNNSKHSNECQIVNEDRGSKVSPKPTDKPRCKSSESKFPKPLEAPTGRYGIKRGQVSVTKNNTSKAGTAKNPPTMAKSHQSLTPEMGGAWDSRGQHLINTSESRPHQGTSQQNLIENINQYHQASQQFQRRHVNMSEMQTHHRRNVSLHNTPSQFCLQ